MQVLTVMKQTYVGLDVIRFGAAVLVMMFHLSFVGWLHAPAYQAVVWPIGKFFTNGGVGVQIFFVLSGFVIAYSASGKTATKFAQGRALRLYPAAWLCASLTALAVWGTPHLGSSYLRSIFLSPLGPWVDPVYWTLGVEIIFYAAVWLQMVLFGNRRLIELGVLLGSISALYWFARIGDYLSGRHLEPLFALFDTPLGNLSLIPNGVEFGLGVLLFSMARDGLKMQSIALSGAYSIAALISVAAAARYRLATVGGLRADLFIEPAILALGICLIVAFVFWNPLLQSKMGHWSGAFRLVGLATYPLYLLHEEIGWRIIKLFKPEAALWGLASAILTVAVAVCLVMAGEPHVRRGLAWVLKDKTSPARVSQLP